MKNKSAIPFVAVAAALILAALYELYQRFPMLPVAATLEAEMVDRAWNGLLVVEGLVYAAIMAFLLYCVWAFRARRRDEQGEKFESSRGHLVETAWLVVSAGLTLGLAALGAQELRALLRDQQADIDVEVRAEQFSWEFYYPQLKAYGSKLFLERGKRHRIILTSKDVVHSFWVPEFRVKQDAVPGKVISMILTPIRAGEYTLLCNQLCGSAHLDMQGVVEVVEHDDFVKNLQTSDF